MSYNTWIEYGYGVCVDHIKTTPERLLQLAAIKPEVLKDVRKYLDETFPDGYKDEDLDIDDFDELEGDYCERGVTYILYNVIDDITVVYADDFDGTPYILYTPSYPWSMNNEEKNLSQDDVKEIFLKYIKILTDELVIIDYYEVHNGG